MVVQATLILFGVFFVMLFSGVPISVGIGIASIVTALFSFDPQVFAITAAQRCFSGIDSFSLLALPFFTCLLYTSKIQDDPFEGDIFRTIRMMHHIRGKYHQLSRADGEDGVLDDMIPCSAFQIIKLIEIMIMGFCHIVIDTFYSFAGDRLSLRDPDTCLLYTSRCV